MYDVFSITNRMNQVQNEPDETGIHFINSLEEKPGNNILESEFFYNGGGVAVGDINQDTLPDTGTDS